MINWSKLMVAGSALFVSTRPSLNSVLGNMLSQSIWTLVVILVFFVRSIVQQLVVYETITIGIIKSKIFLSNWILFPEYVNESIEEKMSKTGELWQCLDCLWTTKNRTRLWEHIEAKHVQSAGYTCQICLKFCPSKRGLINHKARNHRGTANLNFSNCS